MQHANGLFARPRAASHAPPTHAPCASPSHLHRPSRCAPLASTSLKNAPVTEAAPPHKAAKTQQQSNETGVGLGDLLGPIGLTYSGGIQTKADSRSSSSNGNGNGSHAEHAPDTSRPASSESAASHAEPEQATSIHSMTTEEWRRTYERDGTVDLWLEEEFNAGSRLVGGRAVHKGGTYGILTGEGPSVSNATRHKVRIHNHYADQVVDVEVPEDRYILWEAEDEGLQLPYACRMGCCTACAVRVVEGEMYQPEALGISAELREQGYGLMCVGFPMSDLVLETVPEDEVYELQFGKAFATQALDPTNPEAIERDDFALGIATMDE